MISIDFLCQGWGGLDFSNDRGEMAPLVLMVAWGSQMNDVDIVLLKE